ncbi:MAG: DUF3618 domain-containing protein [Actinomycetota bacterium]|nr:DUF3618 domain-containing protein [Actinomycetota bacterium]
MTISSPKLASLDPVTSVHAAQPAKTPSDKTPAETSDKTDKTPAEIRQDIAHTREQLAHTVETLAHKVQVPARVKNKVHGAKETAHAKIDQVKQRLHEGSETLQDKADEATLQATSLTNQTLAKLPPPLARRIAQLLDTARQRPVTTAAVVLGVFVVLRRLRRRSR